MLALPPVLLPKAAALRVGSNNGKQQSMAAQGNPNIRPVRELFFIRHLQMPNCRQIKSVPTPTPIPAPTPTPTYDTALFLPLLLRLSSP